MRSKTISYLGFAKKSGNLIAGTGTCTSAMEKGKIKLLIITRDTAEGSREKLIQRARARGVPLEIYGESETLSHAVGGSGRNVFGITDGHFAKVIREAIQAESENNERKEKEIKEVQRS